MVQPRKKRFFNVEIIDQPTKMLCLSVSGVTFEYFPRTRGAIAQFFLTRSGMTILLQ